MLRYPRQDGGWRYLPKTYVQGWQRTGLYLPAGVGKDAVTVAGTKPVEGRADELNGVVNGGKCELTGGEAQANFTLNRT